MAAPDWILADFPASFSLPVQWGDQDAFGHVNNTVYFRWFESSRIVYLERIGLQEAFDQQRLGPILAAIGCNFRRQLQYPDQVQIGSRVTRIGRTSFVMEHAVFSVQSQALVADGTSTIVVFDYVQQKPTPVPDVMRQAIEAIEGRSL
jgi:acyl-CoA thioester hydrolase